MFHECLKKSEAEAIAYVEFHRTMQQQKLHKFFNTKAFKIDEKKLISSKINQLCFYKSIGNRSCRAPRHDNTFVYNKAKTDLEQKEYRVNRKSLQRKKQNARFYEKEIARIEHGFHERLKAISYTYASVFQIKTNKINDARKLYNDGINAENSLAIETLKETVEAERLTNDLYRRAEAVYHATCDNIENELEWDELAAELSVHAKSFHYFVNSYDCVAMLDQNIIEKETCMSDTSDISRAYHEFNYDVLDDDPELRKIWDFNTSLSLAP